MKLNKTETTRGDISPKSFGKMNLDCTLKNPENSVESRRKIFQTVLVLGLAAVEPGFAMANDQTAVPSVQGHGDPGPNWTPKSLEQRIAGSAFIFIGVPTRFRYVPDDAYKKYRMAHKSDPKYLRLQTESASHAAFREYFDANPGDPTEFRLRDEHEKIEGSEITFLEFDVERVVFKSGPPSNPEMGTKGKRLYFKLGGEFRKGTTEGDRLREPWTPYLGKRVILLSEGYTPNSKSIRLPFPEQALAAGPHLLDWLPIPHSELSQVTAIATRLGFLRVDKP
jgi:hypothetical protein